MDERKKEVMEMLEEMSKEEIADMIVFYSEDYKRTHKAIERLQAKVNSSGNDYHDLAMEVFKAWHLVTYKEEYKG